MQLGFWKHAQDDPSATALIEVPGAIEGAEVSGRELTRGELYAACNQVVHGLRALGLRKGDVIAVMLPNRAEVFEVFMAVAQAGWFVTPVNWHLTAPEVAYILEDSSARAFIADARFADVAVAAADAAGVPAEARFAVGDVTGFRDFGAFKADQPTTTPEERAAGGPMTYTSGTTGKPKGVRRPTGGLDPDTAATYQAMFLGLFGMLPGQPGRHLVVAPTYHTAVLNFSSNHLHLGHSIVLMDKWTPEGMLQVVERCGVTNSHMVPTHFNRLLALPDEVKQRYDVSSLSHVIHSAAPCPVPIKRAMLEWWGSCIYEYYAASEGGGTLATPQDWLDKPGTVGKPWPISQIRILDDDQQPVAVGTPGTVWIKMGDHTFEYKDDPTKTGNAWHDGFFTVGDAGYVDADGFLFLCDRKADMIISGGVNIYPAEVESVLVTHPKVGDVAVFGVPDDDWGEAVKAVVEPSEGVEPGSELGEELLTWAAGRVAKYKMPRSIDFVAVLPRDPNGKLYKRKLRDPYWTGRARQI